MGWIGVVFLIGIDSLTGFGIHIIGQIAILCASFSYACSAIYGRRFKDTPPDIVSAGMMICSVAMMIPIAAIAIEP